MFVLFFADFADGCQIWQEVIDILGDCLYFAAEYQNVQIMKSSEVKTAPRETDAVNVVWRSHAANIMRRVCPTLADKDVCLGRLKLKNLGYNRINGYVVFYAHVSRRSFTRLERVLLWWDEKCSGKKLGDDFIIMVKAFKNNENKPRKAFFLSLKALDGEKQYLPNDTFRAVLNTEWRYAVRGDDCEIICEAVYRREKDS